MGIGLGELAQAKPVEPVECTFALLGLGQANKLERQPGIVEGRAPRQQSVLLEDGCDLAAEIVEIGVRTSVSDMDQSLCRRLETDHQVEKSGLSATGLADDCHNLARRNGQIEALDCDHRLPRRCLTEDLAQAAHFDRRGATHARHRRTRVSTRATIASRRNSKATRTSVQANTSATENNSCATDN